MPPKKAQTKFSAAEKPAETGANPQPVAESKDQAPTSKTTDGAEADVISKKRKAPALSKPNKAPRRSTRSADPSAPVDAVKILQFLLSPSSLDLCRPKDEFEDLKTRGTEFKTYSTSTFAPFEELACAVILSRPIGHMLGIRSIRTIFNAPYEFTTPRKIREAGNGVCREALDQARTQHRQKTAEALVLLADAVVDRLGYSEEDVTLERVRKESGHDREIEREMLRKNVTGLGKTGLDIFGRRIQGVWPEFYPFVDQRTLVAVEKLGLPGSAEELRDMLDENWEKFEVKDIEAEDEEEKKRKGLVRILDRAVGADLEGNIDAIKSEAA
ncbi:MAG: hypothetical protein ALECFALPRED_005171 [Alectoria fallacina]|uniref:Uncharacterized protein n=1 Tax=Alectoria fallacina TaxID=1903189 RepID=A0A8H3IAA6_9LECA|nr:MAG: hypothetical protein ALECFALPRED_005171 [Alectoria fallacina]